MAATTACKYSIEKVQQKGNSNPIKRQQAMEWYEREVGDVSRYKYTLNFNPKMWIPAEIGIID